MNLKTTIYCVCGTVHHINWAVIDGDFQQYTCQCGNRLTVARPQVKEKVITKEEKLAETLLELHCIAHAIGITPNTKKLHDIGDRIAKLTAPTSRDILLTERLAAIAGCLNQIQDQAHKHGHAIATRQIIDEIYRIL